MSDGDVVVGNANDTIGQVPSVTVSVLFFAGARDAVQGQSQISITLSPTDDTNIVTTQTLRAHLIQLFPKLAQYIHEDITAITLALNEEYIPFGVILPIKNGDTVAIIPPISGG